MSLSIVRAPRIDGKQVYAFTCHYKFLFNALCRGDRSLRQNFACKFCGLHIRLPIREYLKHHRVHQAHNRCLVCGFDFSTYNLQYVYFHLSTCLYPGRPVLTRRNVYISTVKSTRRSRRLKSPYDDDDDNNDPTELSPLNIGHRVLSRQKLYSVLRNIFLSMPIQLRFHCNFCREEMLVHHYLPHQAKPGHDRQSCLVCRTPIYQLNFSKVYTHLMCCLLPPNMAPSDRRNVKIDKEYWNHCVESRRNRARELDGSHDDLQSIVACLQLSPALMQKFVFSIGVSNNQLLPAPIDRFARKFFVRQDLVKLDATRRLLSSLRDIEKFAPANVMALDKINVYAPDLSSDLNCLACDRQRERAVDCYRDRWPDHGGVKPTFEWPRASIVENFLSNDAFRLQYDHVPLWLEIESPVERLDYERTGVSSRMAKLLYRAFSCSTTTLRHYYFYDYRARESLRELFEQPDRCYVFPFSCLCSTRCFHNNSLEIERLSSVRPEANDANTDDDACFVQDILSYVSRVYVNNLQMQKPTTIATTTVTETLPDLPKDKYKTNVATANIRRTYGNFLEYLQRQLTDFDKKHAYRRCYLHRHLLVCFRTSLDAQKFNHSACGRFSSSVLLNSLPAWQTEMQERYPHAYAYLARPGAYYTIGGYHEFTSVGQLVDTLAALGSPQKRQARSGRATNNFSAQILELDRLYAEYRSSKMTAPTTQLEPIIAQIAGQLVDSFNGRHVTVASNSSDSYRHTLQTCVSNPTNTTVGRLFHPLGRFFLYNRFARDRDALLVDRYKRMLEFTAQPMGWEEQYFYISVPMIPHAYHMYLSMIPHAVASIVNKSVKRNVRLSNQLLQLLGVVFSCTPDSMYTRLGYILNDFITTWPIDHRLPTVACRAYFAHDHALETGAIVRFADNGTVEQSSSQRLCLFGDLCDLPIELYESTLRIVLDRLQQLLASEVDASATTVQDSQTFATIVQAIAPSINHVNYPRSVADVYNHHHRRC